MHCECRKPSDVRLLDDLKAIVWVADPSTNQFLYVSAHAEALLGFPIQAWLTRPAFLSEILHPTDRETALTKWRQAIDGAIDPVLEYRVVAADGGVHHVRNILTVQRGPDGMTERLCGLMVDLCELGLPAGTNEIDWYQHVALEHGLDVTAITDRQGVISRVSPSAEAVLGTSPTSLCNRSIFEIMHPDDSAELDRLFRAAFTHGKPPATVLLGYGGGDGAWRTLEAVGRSVDADEGPAMVINARDVTARVHLERELRRAQKMEALARITSAVAHDFNNLLTVIHGNVELALLSAPDEHVAQALLEILQAAEIGKTMTNQLNTFGGRRRRAILIDVNATIKQFRPLLARILRPLAVLDVHLRAVNGRVMMEGGTLQQVLLNLVVNAREALRGEGRVSISTRNLSLPSAQENGDDQEFVEIEVADTGIGMTAGVRDQVFELYFTTKEEPRGSGIGLATVYAFVRDAGGTISLDSEPGQGSTFRIRLPVVSRR